MRSFMLICVAALAAGVFAQDVSLRAVTKAFKDAKIPEDITLGFKPKALLEVTFPQEKGKSITLHAGVHLPRNATKGPPTIKVVGLREPGPYVIATVDPDAPTPQNRTVSQVRHYLAGNLALDWFGGSLKNQTAAVTEFLQPTPPAGSDAHRYIFLLFKQPKDFNKQEVITPTTSPIFFNISDFAKTVGLGEPLAGTFMLVAPDPPAPA